MKKLLWAAAGLILIVNSTVLARAFYNRLEPNQGQITLSERELPLAWRDFGIAENNSLALRLDWSTLHDKQRPAREPQWLTEEKLAELGIRANLQPSSEDGYDLLVVLEFDGLAYQSDLAKARAELQVPVEDSEKAKVLNKARQDALNHLERRASRLYAMDAGLDLDTLRKRYPARDRYLILPGRLQVNHYQTQNQARLSTYLSLRANDPLNMPYQLRKLWQAQPAPPNHYQIQLTVGRSLEPWLSDLSIEKQP